ncbi:MAG: O-antigen ligase family protein [Methylacidiphilales bacterium]|nr:O-antigen ligase family protein [Candidatus Methylacidiphilales bacterium]
MNDRRTARPFEHAFAIAALFLFSGVVYGAFAVGTEIGTRSGETLLYKAVWATICLTLWYLIALRYRSVMSIFARNILVTLFMFSYILSEIVNIGDHGDPIRLVLLLSTIAFSAWLSSVFSLDQIYKLLATTFFGIIAVHTLIAGLFGNIFDAGFAGMNNLFGTKVIFGLFGHKNQAGLVFGISLILLYIISADYRGTNNYTKLRIGAALSGFFLILAGSALAIVTVLASLSVLAWMSSLNFRNRVWLQAVTVITFCGAVATAFDPSLLLGALGRSSDFSGRTPIWDHWHESFLEQPWFGYGYTGFFVHDGPAQMLAYRLSYDGPPTNFHNSYLDIGIQTGAFGLLLMAAIIWLALWRSAVVAFNSRRMIDIFPLAMLVGLCVYACGETIIPTHNNFATVLFFTLYFKITSVYGSLERKLNRRRLFGAPLPVLPPRNRPPSLPTEDRAPGTPSDMPKVS